MGALIERCEQQRQALQSIKDQVAGGPALRTKHYNELVKSFDIQHQKLQKLFLALPALTQEVDSSSPSVISKPVVPGKLSSRTSVFENRSATLPPPVKHDLQIPSSTTKPREKTEFMSSLNSKLQLGGLSGVSKRLPVSSLPNGVLQVGIASSEVEGANKDKPLAPVLVMTKPEEPVVDSGDSVAMRPKLTHMQLDRPKRTKNKAPQFYNGRPISASKRTADTQPRPTPKLLDQSEHVDSSIVVVETAKKEPDQIILLRQALDALEHGREPEALGSIRKLSESFPDSTKPIFGTVYEMAKKDQKYAKQLNHPKFGRVAFFGEDKRNVSIEIKIAAVKAALESELKKLSATQ